MPEEQEGGSPFQGAASALKKVPTPAWVIGGGLVLFLLFRSRSGGASPAAVYQESQLAASINAEEQAARARQQSALDAMEFKRAERFFKLEELYGQAQEVALQRNLMIEQQLSEKAKRVKFQCPPGQGSLKKDPTTGQLYCRPKARRGNTWTDLVGGAYDVLGLYQTYQTGGAYPGGRR